MLSPDSEGYSGRCMVTVSSRVSVRAAVLRYCYAYLGNVHDAEDAAQDILAVVSAREQLPRGRFRPWLYRVARNRCLNLLRDSRGEPRGVWLSGSRWPSPRTGPRTAALRAEARERVRQVLAEMSDEHRDVLILRYFEELSRQEMAEVLELPASVIKSRLFEAFQKLRERLRETESLP